MRIFILLMTVCFCVFFQAHSQAIDDSLRIRSDISGRYFDPESVNTAFFENEDPLFPADWSVDINGEDSYQLVESMLLTNEEFLFLKKYIELAGKLIDIHELQTVPGWSVSLIKKIQSHVYVKTVFTISDLFQKSTKDKNGKFLLKTRFAFPLAEEYNLDTATHSKEFRGSPQ